MASIHARPQVTAHHEVALAPVACGGFSMGTQGCQQLHQHLGQGRAFFLLPGALTSGPWG